MAQLEGRCCCVSMNGMSGDDAYILGMDYVDEKLDNDGGIKGEDGFSPIITENPDNTDEVYKLDVTTKDGTFTTANLIGKQGVQGIQGIQGERGEQGETGLQGQQGIQGVKGEKGDDGYPFLIYKQYEVGIEEFNEADFPEIGLMFMIHVFEEDKGYPVYRYTADGTDTPYSLVTYMNTEGIKGEKGDRGEQGEQGIAGLDGKDGKDGTTYTPSIGEVTTVDSNELASATVSVNTETKEAVFNFAIPKGNKGLDSVQISDNETVENKTWSSKKTSSELLDILKKVYPIGSVYINVTDINPFDILGFGTWERFAQNMTLWGASDSGQVGTIKNAGLPNITGEFGAQGSSDFVNVGTGAFRVAQTGRIDAGHSANINYSLKQSFNASRSSSIYGNSDTVQPPALVVNIWKRTA